MCILPSDIQSPSTPPNGRYSSALANDRLTQHEVVIPHQKIDHEDFEATNVHIGSPLLTPSPTLKAPKNHDSALHGMSPQQVLKPNFIDKYLQNQDTRKKIQGSGKLHLFTCQFGILKKYHMYTSLVPYFIA